MGSSIPARASLHDDTVRVLEADPDLAEMLDERQLEEARGCLVAPAVDLAKGDWTPRQAVPSSSSGHLGVLVTEGVLCREVAIGNSVCAELVGPGVRWMAADGRSTGHGSPPSGLRGGGLPPPSGVAGGRGLSAESPAVLDVTPGTETDSASVWS